MINCGTVLQSERSPNERHMVNDPTTIAERLQFGNLISVPNTNGAAMYMIPIAVVPMMGMLWTRRRAHWCYNVIEIHHQTRENLNRISRHEDPSWALDRRSLH